MQGRDQVSRNCGGKILYCDAEGHAQQVVWQQLIDDASEKNA